MHQAGALGVRRGRVTTKNIPDNHVKNEYSLEVMAPKPPSRTARTHISPTSGLFEYVAAELDSI